jgi:hypothetical protein
LFSLARRRLGDLGAETGTPRLGATCSAVPRSIVTWMARLMAGSGFNFRVGRSRPARTADDGVPEPESSQLHPITAVYRPREAKFPACMAIAWLRDATAMAKATDGIRPVARRSPGRDRSTPKSHDLAATLCHRERTDRSPTRWRSGTRYQRPTCISAGVEPTRCRAGSFRNDGQLRKSTEWQRVTG